MMRRLVGTIASARTEKTTTHLGLLKAQKKNSYERSSVIEQKATFGTPVGKDIDYIGGRLSRLSRRKDQH